MEEIVTGMVNVLTGEDAVEARKNSEKPTYDKIMDEADQLWRTCRSLKRISGSS